jgi:hypothetical protein
MMGQNDEEEDAKIPFLPAASGPSSRKVINIEGSGGKEKILKEFLAEFIGTFVFLLIGLSATTSSVVTGAQVRAVQHAAEYFNAYIAKQLHVALTIYSLSIYIIYIFLSIYLSLAERVESGKALWCGELPCP